MVLLLTAVLLFSCAGMALLFWAKNWELTTGRVLLAPIRPRLHTFSHNTLVFIEGHMPRALQQFAARAFVWMRTFARHSVARVLLSAESGLEHALYGLRHGIVPPQESQGQASQFLREVTEYKKRLMRRPRERRMLEVE